MNKYNYVGELVMVKINSYTFGKFPDDYNGPSFLLGIVIEQYSRKTVLVQIITEGKFQGHKWRVANCSCPPFFDLHPSGHKDNKFHVLNEKKANPL